MVLWRPRKTIVVMEPAGQAAFSPLSSDASGQASPEGHYTVPPASPIDSADPITAVRRANSPERNVTGREGTKPRQFQFKRPQNLQLSLKNRTVQNSFPAKPSRARFMKSKRAVPAPSKGLEDRLIISGSGSGSSAKSPLKSSETHQQPDRTWRGGVTGESLGLSGATGDLIREKYNLSPAGKRRGSVALPLNRPATYDNHPNLKSGARPKSGLPAYRRVHYHLRSDYESGRPLSPNRGGRTTPSLQDGAAKSPSTSRCTTPQPNFASEYIAEIFQTSDKFLISRPGSGQQRPASACPPSRPKSAQRSSFCPSPGKTYKVRPASALAVTNTAKNHMPWNKNRAQSAQTYKPGCKAGMLVTLPSPSLKHENLLVQRSNSPDQNQTTKMHLLDGDKTVDMKASLNLSEHGRSPSIHSVISKNATQLTSQKPASREELDSWQTEDTQELFGEDRETTVELACSPLEHDEVDQLDTFSESEFSGKEDDSTSLSPLHKLEQQEGETSLNPQSNFQHGWTRSLESLSTMEDWPPKSKQEPECEVSFDEDRLRHASDTAVRSAVEALDPNASEKAARLRPRTAATREDLTVHLEAEKQAVLDDLRSDLRRRLQLRKKSGITNDSVFQKQIQSSFWTADMLYHRWGNDMLEMRKKWKSDTGRLEDQEAEEGPTFPRGRRGGFSNERTENSPLDFEALRSISIVNASLHRAQSTDTPSGSPTASQVSFKGPLAVRRSTTNAASLRSPTPPLIRQDSKVELRPQAPQSLADVNVGLRLMAHMHEDPEKRRLRLRALFIDTVTKVRRIARVALCMIRSSKDLNVANFMAQLHFYNTRTMEEELTFEKEKFSRKYSKLHVPNWAREIGLKPPWDRTPDDVMALYSILKNLKSFEKFTHQMRMEICRAATYSCCEKGRVILRQGHVGHNFYFIFSGSVFVQIDIEDAKTGIMTPSKTHVMEKGASFGELALLGGGSGTRRASIICRETTELFEIEKETFLELCPDIFEKELQEKISAARNVGIFRQFPPEDLERLCFESFIEEVAYGRVIERNTANTDTIYFILDGKVTMLKEFELSVAHHDASIQAYGDKTLPTPKAGRGLTEGGRQTLPQATDKDTCFMRVGELRVGDTTEIALMHASKDRTSPGVILVSNGVRLMQMPKRKLERFAPKEVVETLRRQPVQPLRIPPSDELYKKYLGDVNWAEFRTKVVDTLQEERRGAPIVSKPSTAKGSTGWARWPGSGVKGAPSCGVRAQSAPPRVRRRGVVSM